MASETLPIRQCGKTTDHGPHDYRHTNLKKYHCGGLNRRSPQWRRDEAKNNK